MTDETNCAEERRRARMQRIVDTAKATFRDIVRPVYGMALDGVPFHIGSCLLLNIRDDRFLLTAAHVLDDARGTDLLIGASTTVPVIGECSRSSSEGNRVDYYDFALCKLSNATVADMNGVQFATPSDFTSLRDNLDGRHCLALGYPWSRNKKSSVNPKTKSIRPAIWPYHNIAKDAPALRTRLALPAGDHVFLPFNKKQSFSAAGEPQFALTPTGMSGGALIDLGDIDWNRSTDPKPRLAALLTRLPRNSHYMVATRLTTILKSVGLATVQVQ